MSGNLSLVLHPGPLGEGGGAAIGEGKGSPLGSGGDVKKAAREMPFSAGAALFLYGDGIIENRDKDGKIIGRAGIGDYAWKLFGPAGVEPGAEALAHPIPAAAGRAEDDMTVACRRRALSAAA